ncbi:helix-turn-helix domain-containing protein [Azospirillum sp. B506]|uniref:helix-turn-helix domain-containing protein n=1 Tax=Azospirillum sp. B506 TaxID=137721 RepID=UPI0035D4F17F
MPPLRDRPDDIPVLARHILERLSAAHGKPVAGFAPDTLACLEAYGWPGNVREMQNEIMRMLVLCEGDVLGADLLSDPVLRGAALNARPASPEDGPLPPLDLIGQGGPLKSRIERVEAGILMETLVRCRWNKSKAADELGLSRMGLRAKLERYGIERGPAQRH